VESKSVTEYIDRLPADQKNYLTHLRALIFRLVPDAVESISYMMPAYKYKKKPLIYYDAFKNHLSLFAAGKAAILELGDKLTDFHISAGTIQFTPEKPLPDELIQKIIEYKIKEIETTKPKITRAGHK
jgi:uncharacterized protein YdhG (YjbR/CyaY superfamily)